MAKYLCNAFSGQMLDPDMQDVLVCRHRLTQDEVNSLDLTKMESFVGHPDTAAVLGVTCNRGSIKLQPGDVLVVAQVMGGRLPEGTTVLPEGFSLQFDQYTIVD